MGRDYLIKSQGFYLDFSFSVWYNLIRINEIYRVSFY